MEEALKREIREETGIEIQNIEQLGFDEDNEPDKHGEMTHYIFLDFRTEWLSGEITAGDDMKELKWVKKDELKNLFFNRPAKKLLKKLNFI